MKIPLAILTAMALHAGSSSVQAPPALKTFLESQPPTKPTSRAVDYRVSFKSFHQGKPKDVFQDAGVMFMGTTDNGAAWISATRLSRDLQIGELPPPPEGQRWFKQLCEPSRMSPLVDPGAFLGRLINQSILKKIENPTDCPSEPGDQILVYPLEAPRPVAKIWSFHSKTGEARLHIRKDGSPVSLEVVQVYEGRLSPHFGPYLLNRREVWAFSVVAGQVHTTTYRLSLRRQDWKAFIEGDVEMTVGGLP